MIVVEPVIAAVFFVIVVITVGVEVVGRTISQQERATAFVVACARTAVDHRGTSRE